MAATGSFQGVVVSLTNTVQAINAITQTIKNAPTKIWSAFVPSTIADGATVAIDMGTAINFTLALTNAGGSTRTIANPTNAKPGQRGYILTTQPANGGLIVTFGSLYQASGGVASLTPSLAENAVNLYNYTVLPSGAIALSLLSNLEH